MEFAEKFEIEKLQITKVGSWIISLRPEQVTLGSLILSLERTCFSLGELTQQEGTDLSKAFEVIDQLLKKTFKPDKINYLALMMVDDQVHFHVMPRYSSVIQFDGKEYADENWPKPPVLTDLFSLSERELLQLTYYIKKFSSV